MSCRIAIIVSQFNQEITAKLLQGAISRLTQKGLVVNDITIVKVPGAVEIPLAATLLARKKIYQAVICLGAVIRGETGHYDYVCEQVSQGCQRVMLDHEIPVIFGVLTTDTVRQAEDRAGGIEGNKGEDAADAAMAMIRVVQDIGLSPAMA